MGKHMKLTTIYIGVLWVLFMPQLSPASAATIYVVANKAAKTFDVTNDQLKQLFLDETTIVVNGVKLRPIDAPPGSDVRRDFYKIVAQRSNTQMKSYWARMVFTGKGVPPETSASELEVEKTVAQSEQKIGYLSHKPTDPNVQIVKILEN